MSECCSFYSSAFAAKAGAKEAPVSAGRYESFTL